MLCSQPIFHRRPSQPGASGSAVAGSPCRVLARGRPPAPPFARTASPSWISVEKCLQSHSTLLSRLETVQLFMLGEKTSCRRVGSDQHARSVSVQRRRPACRTCTQAKVVHRPANSHTVDDRSCHQPGHQPDTNAQNGESRRRQLARTCKPTHGFMRHRIGEGTGRAGADRGPRLGRRGQVLSMARPSEQDAMAHPPSARHGRSAACATWIMLSSRPRHERAARRVHAVCHAGSPANALLSSPTPSHVAAGGLAEQFSAE